METVTNLNDDLPAIGKELFQTAEEQEQPIQLEVKGKIPSWLSGSLLRVGPGKFEWGKSNYNHWFDGQALMHKFDIRDGNILYSSKYLHSESYEKSHKYGRVATPGFATWAPPDPCKNIFKRFFLYFLPPAMTDNCNINIVRMKEEAFTFTESPYFYHINPETLATGDRQNFRSILSGPRSLLVHPHYDKEGNVHNISADWLRFQYEIFKVSPSSADGNPFSGAQIVATVPFSFTSPAYFHSFGLTENYYILVENPFVLSVFWKLMIMNFMKWSYFDILEWKPEKMSRFHVVHRKTGLVAKTFFTSKFFAFHHVNAYESENEVIVDVCGYPDASVVKAFYLHNLRSGLKDTPFKAPSLRRYRLPKSAFMQNAMNETHQESTDSENNVDYEVLMNGLELPRINYEYNAMPYKYAYGVVYHDDEFSQNLAKINVDTKDVKLWIEEHCYPSEPVFISAPDQVHEDDGIILSAVVGALGKPSFLLILDSKTFNEIARAEVPNRLALTFHGIFKSF